MAKSPEKKMPASDGAPGFRKRGSPLTDYLDAAVPLERGGFEEAPQPALSGKPVSGSISSWADEIAREAEAQSEAPPAVLPDISPSRGEIGKSRKPSKKIPERSSAPTRSGRGTSMGGAASPKERAAAGLNPVAGLDIALEDAGKLAAGAVTATVQALADLIESGNPLHKNGELWVPHRPARPEKSEGGLAIQMVSDFEPAGDQPQAIKDLVAGVAEKERTQVLLGVTGSGKTFTMAKVIEETQRPALILAPNKTLAAQLYSEFKKFFPDNAVEYFVSYYDYYQPEPTFRAPTPSSRRKARSTSRSTACGIRRRVRCWNATTSSSSPRCPASTVSARSRTYTAMTFQMSVRRPARPAPAARRPRRAAVQAAGHQLRARLVPRARRHDRDLPRPPRASAWRISLFGDEIETITEFDPLTGQKTGDLKSVKIYANSHYVTPRPTLNQAIKSIKEELQHRLQELEKAGRLLEAQRLEQRTRFDLEMLEATGSCAGIENYSRYLTGRRPGDPPPTLFEYIPDNALVFVDESHVTIPQIGGMYRGDFRRKATLAEYGFRLPSCMDNRPLRFEEWDAMRPLSVAVSATPSAWEMEQAGGVFAEQVIRPTGLIDPPVEVRPAKNQVDDVVGEIRETTKKGYRTLVTVLTKRMAEDLTEYLHEHGVRVRYMHSDIETLERIEILRDLRLGAFDVLVGINLLREGLDIPECGFVAILDADKEGFLRSETSLIQTIGRAARNVDGKVILYAEQVTGSMERAMAETNRRREKQLAYNTEHGITPESVKSRISDILDSVYEKDHVRPDISDFAADGNMVGNNLKAHLEYLQKKMRDAATDLNFEEAARMRDEIKRLTELELTLSDDPLARQAEMQSPSSGREKGKHNKGVAKHRTAEEQERFRKLGEARAAEEAARAARQNLFRKPELDEMGTSGDHAVPAGAVPRSLFKKQSASEAHESDYGVRDDGASLFRKNSLDEMTVRRTEKPVEGVKPVKRAKIGAGSYEDPADEAARKKRTGKSGRPGH
jgi:excinuclease ABC subunit B